MKIRTKLVLAFSLIVFVMAGIQVAFSKHLVESLFNRLPMKNAMVSQDWPRIIGEYYREHKGWQGIDNYLTKEFFKNYPATEEEKRIPKEEEQKPSFGDEKNLDDNLVLLDNANNVVYVTPSRRLNPILQDESHRKDFIKRFSARGMPIIVDGQQVGRVWVGNRLIGAMERGIARSMILANWIGIGITTFLVFLVALWLARRISSPINMLMAATREIAGGNLAHRVKYEGKDEIANLASSFNKMVEDLQRNEQVRRNMVADIAHELRTPLSILGGQLESIQEGAMDASPEVVASLHDEVLRLSRMVKELQDLSLAEAGRLPLHLAEINIGQLVGKVVDNFAMEAENRSIQLKFFKDQDLPLIKIDGDRIKQVVINLIGNAMQHTAIDGEITVSVTRHSNSSLSEFLKVEITDTGPGLSQDHLSNIFERFYRADSSRNRKEGGIGLGLAIAKSFVEAHDGVIGVDSSPGQGSSFWVKIPLSRKVEEELVNE